VRFYDAFLFLVTLLAIFSLISGAFGMSRIDDFGDCVCTAAAVLISVTVTAILTILAIIVLEFSSRSLKAQYKTMDAIMSWMPSFLLNLVALEIAMVRLLWYNSSHHGQLALFLVTSALILLFPTTIISLWLRRNIKKLLFDLAYLEGEGDEEHGGNDDDDDGDGDDGFGYYDIYIASKRTNTGGSSDKERLTGIERRVWDIILGVHGRIGVRSITL
jgi:hypothetical protein